jgi:hypothetical protein
MNSATNRIRPQVWKWVHRALPHQMITSGSLVAGSTRRKFIAGVLAIGTALLKIAFGCRTTTTGRPTDVSTFRGTGTILSTRAVFFSRRYHSVDRFTPTATIATAPPIPSVLRRRFFTCLFDQTVTTTTTATTTLAETKITTLGTTIATSGATTTRSILDCGRSIATASTISNDSKTGTTISIAMLPIVRRDM